MNPVDSQFYVVAPDRSLAQRMDALQSANRIRTHRADLKRDLKAGRKGLLDLLDDPDCATMKIADALVHLPKVGRVKVNKTLMQCRISPSKTLAGLTLRQRSELAGHLRPEQLDPKPKPLAAVA